MFGSDKNIWIHCNICVHKFDANDRRYFVLNCSPKHVLCEICMGKTNRGTMCPVCKTGIRYMELNERMDSKVKAYFDVEARFEMMVHLKSVSEFQKSQFDNLFNATNAMTVKYEKALEVKREKEAESARMDEKYEMARAYRRQLQHQYNQLVEKEQARSRNKSSEYSSQQNAGAGGPFISGAASGPVSNVFDRPSVAPSTANFFNMDSQPSTSAGFRPTVASNIFGRPPMINRSQEFHAGPSGIDSPMLPPFSKQKASTPREESRRKVLTQEFSFKSTPSTVGRHRR